MQNNTPTAVAIENLGCKVNRYESDAIAQSFRAAGYALVDYSEHADIYILNTCGVTTEAARKSRQQLHKAKRKNPRALVVAIGCQAELAPDELPADLCIGNIGKERLVETIEAYLKHGIQPDASAIGETRDFAEFGAVTDQAETRAYLKVQDGCNNFCSYCAIPLARGRVRSRAEDRILEEAAQLGEAGFKEVVLTGIHVCSYGADRGEGSTALVDLIAKIARIDGIERIRLSSLEPQSITEEFIEKAAKIPKLCPHFHLSLQSGADPVLRAMNRRYDTALYRQAVEGLRAAFPHVGITTDIIVGFPGETEKDFQDTLAFCEEMAFSRLHVFRYSERPGTRAVSLPGKVPAALAKTRSETLIKLGEDLQSKALLNASGRVSQVLLESRDEHGFRQGYTPDYLLAAVEDKAGVLKEGQIVDLRLTEVQGNRINAEIATGLC